MNISNFNYSEHSLAVFLTSAKMTFDLTDHSKEGREEDVEKVFQDTSCCNMMDFEILKHHDFLRIATRRRDRGWMPSGSSVLIRASHTLEFYNLIILVLLQSLY